MNGSPDPRLDRLTCAPERYRDVVRFGWKQYEPLELAGPVQVQRDPCPKCGTRGDLACAHRPAVEAVPVVIDLRGRAHAGLTPRAKR